VLLFPVFLVSHAVALLPAAAVGAGHLAWWLDGPRKPALIGLLTGYLTLVGLAYLWGVEPQLASCAIRPDC
jgi:hypothetical protein